jgi:hypothetical protein
MMQIMNSSTSSSDRPVWSGFIATFVLVAALVLAAIVGAAYAIDPYDTGRSALLAKAGVRPQGPRTAAPSRGRDPAFNAAIIGNSHIQLLSPERLDAATGLRFVQLSVPASGPKEQFVIIDWFLRHRQSAARALVVSMDESWCTQDPEMANSKPFPFWLFDENPLTYASNLIRYDILEEAPRRIGYVLDQHAERARPDGYWNYEPDYLNLGYGRDRAIRERLNRRPPDDDQVVESDPEAGQRVFPAAARLKELARSLSPETRLIGVFPPMFINYLPLPRTRRGYLHAECKSALSEALSTHKNSVLVDWQVDRPENRDQDLYFDMTHYRLPIAYKIEAQIEAALRRQGP